MTSRREKKLFEAEAEAWAVFLPDQLRSLSGSQQDIPRIAKDKSLLAHIEQAVQRLPTHHALYHGDARHLRQLASASVHLILTSPPRLRDSGVRAKKRRQFLALSSGAEKASYDASVRPNGQRAVHHDQSRNATTPTASVDSPNRMNGRPEQR